MYPQSRPMLNIFLSVEVKYYRESQEREDTIMYTMLWIMNGKQPLNPCILFSLQKWMARQWTTFLSDPRQRAANRLRTRNSRNRRTGKRVRGKQGHCWLGSTKSESATCNIQKRHAIHEKLREGSMVEKRQGNYVPSAFSQ